MSITKEQIEARELIKGLRSGDVVEIRHASYPDVVISGALHEEGRALCLGHTLIRDGNGAAIWGGALTVVSRAPRPLYVNSDRTEPVPGDVVTLADHVHILGEYQPTWFWPERGEWHGTYSAKPIHGAMPARLRLLVDGTTGQVVPS